MNLPKGLDAPVARSVQKFVWIRKKMLSAKQGNPNEMRLGGSGTGVCYNQAAQRRKSDDRAKSWKSWKVCTVVSFFCGAGFCDQLSMVTIPAKAAGDNVRGNLWGSFGRRFGGSGFSGATICAGGAGPRHSARGAAAL